MQKKARAPALFLALALMLSLAANAAVRPPDSPNYDVTSRCELTLLFSGTQATCELKVRALTGCTVTGTLTLYQGDTVVDSWPISGTTRVNFSDTCTVKRGLSYKLVADLTVTGAAGTDEVYEYVTKTA